MYLNTNRDLFLGKTPFKAKLCSKQEFILKLCRKYALVTSLQKATEFGQLYSSIFQIEPNPLIDKLENCRKDILAHNEALLEDAFSAHIDGALSEDEEWDIVSEFSDMGSESMVLFDQIRDLRFEDYQKVLNLINYKNIKDHYDSLDPRDVATAISVYFDYFADFDKELHNNFDKRYGVYDEEILARYFDPEVYDIYTDFYDIDGVCVLGHLANNDDGDYAPFFEILYFDENDHLNVYIPTYGNFVDSVGKHNSFTYDSGSDFFEYYQCGNNDRSCCWGYLNTIMEDVGFEDGEFGVIPGDIDPDYLDMEMKFYAEYNTEYMFKDIESNMESITS